jgi:hypothetical protein
LPGSNGLLGLWGVTWAVYLHGPVRELGQHAPQSPPRPSPGKTKKISFLASQAGASASWASGVVLLTSLFFTVGIAVRPSSPPHLATAAPPPLKMQRGRMRCCERGYGGADLEADCGERITAAAAKSALAMGPIAREQSRWRRRKGSRRGEMPAASHPGQHGELALERPPYPGEASPILGRRPHPYRGLSPWTRVASSPRHGGPPPCRCLSPQCGELAPAQRPCIPAADAQQGVRKKVWLSC